MSEPAGSWWRPVLLVMSAVVIGHGFGRFSFPFVLPDMRTDIVPSYGAAGWLGTASFGSYFVGVIIVTTLARRVASTTMVKGGLVGAVAGMGILAVAPSYAVALVGMAVSGFAAAFTWIPAPAVVAAVAPPERRGLAVGVTTMGAGIGILLAGRIVALVHGVAGEDAWRPVWAIQAALGAAVTVAVFGSLRHLPVAAATSEMRSWALRRLPRAGAALAVYTAYGVVYTLFTSFLVAALEDDAGFTGGHAALVYSLLGLTSVAGGVLIGRLSDTTGRRSALVAGYFVMAACALLITVDAEPWASLSGAVFGLLMTGLGTVVAAYVADHLEPADVGPAFGGLTLGLGVAQIVGPPVGGWLADQTGSFDATYTLIAVAAVAGAVASMWLLGPRSRSPEPTAAGISR